MSYDEYEIEMPPLHPGQKPIHNHPARFKVVAGGRRVGKTTLGVAECVDAAVNAGRTWWVAPSLGQANEGWHILINEFAGKIPRTRVLLGERTVEFPGGGMVQIRTAADPDKLRGPGLDGLVLDEAAFMEERAWSQVLRPALTDRKGWALFISSPAGRDNWFYELFEQVPVLGDDWARFQLPTSSNPKIDPEEIEAARSLLPATVFAQEFLAEFTIPGGNIFKQAWLKHYDESEHYYNLDGKLINKKDCWYFSSVDLAASTKEEADFTCMGIYAVSPFGDMILNSEIVWDRMEAPDIVPEMQRIFRKYRLGFLGVEKNGLGLPIVQYAIRAGLPIKPIDAGKNDIFSRAMPAAARMEAGKIWFPRSTVWINAAESELLAFPESMHDDFVAQLSYAAIEVGGGVITDIGKLVESPDPFNLDDMFATLESQVGHTVSTDSDALVETEGFEGWEEF